MKYLIDQTDVRHSTMREYVIRLRRLDDILLAKNHPAETFSPAGVQQRLIEYLPEKERMLYRSALRKYDQYLSWQRLY
ncbi:MULTISPECIES: site-specific integrase [Symbiopectobacterium]|uniref:site-specific integrase n=1 Tax=Symbiopectobacterium TaxID=801 RepID=UPI001A314111|nr:site-specific integrase [Candidatus Symbiopectobacterium endolongispinus]MBG6248487.1 hypothetical protein [Candidatus Symbiopectobacterium sp. PLON1]MBT9428887.1 site-specific integrase [Candidatus Symbiopectobacterium endolongispinus]